MTTPTPPLPQLKTNVAREAIVAATKPLTEAVNAELQAGNTEVGMMLNELVLSLFALAIRFPDFPRGEQ